jgi:hypothetical protein
MLIVNVPTSATADRATFHDVCAQSGLIQR